MAFKFNLRRYNTEKCIGYAESHDQSIVGDKAGRCRLTLSNPR